MAERRGKKAEYDFILNSKKKKRGEELVHSWFTYEEINALQAVQEKYN